jgi:hypothetical protein
VTYRKGRIPTVRRSRHRQRGGHRTLCDVWSFAVSGVLRDHYQPPRENAVCISDGRLILTRNLTHAEPTHSPSTKYANEWGMALLRAGRPNSPSSRYLVDLLRVPESW